MQIGSFSLIKELNTSFILKTIIKHKSISRADIAKITGLTPATVTNITAELLKHKIILETRLGESSGGRKPVLIEFNYAEYNVVGVAISKHAITVALTDLDSNLVIRKTEEISSDITPESALSIIKIRISEIISSAQKKILGIGVSMEGLIDEKNGICVISNNFNWENVNIKAEIAKSFDYPIFVDNDVNALTLGEKFFGTAKNITNFILLHTGYGIGAGFVNDGHIYRGASNYALEIGRTIIAADDPESPCGEHGYLRSLASGSALIKEIKKLGYDKKYFNNEEITAEKVVDKANAGNCALDELLKKQAHYISVALTNIISIFNPPLVIVTGFICKTNKKIIAEIINQIKKNAIINTFNDVNIIFSKSETNDSYKGAVALFISEFLDNPELYLR